MQLVIQNPDDEVLDEFLTEVIDMMKKGFMYSEGKLEARDPYLQQYLPEYKWIQILLLAIHNLHYFKQGNNYIITINRNIILYKTQFKVYSLVKLLEYGNREIPPYSLFNPMFEDYARKLPMLYEVYLTSKNSEYNEETNEE